VSVEPAVEYRVEELMVCRIAAEVDASGVTVLGSFTPLAYASYMLAKLTHARAATVVGFNAVGIEPLRLSLTGAEAAIYRSAAARWTFGETTQTVHLGGRGLVECLSPAQIDGDGAFNLSVIGDYADPKVRLPGGAGSPEVIQHYERIIVYFGRHDRRTLVEKVDFRTGQRSPIGASARRARGLLAGEVRIVTPLAVMAKHDDDAPFRLETVHPGVSVEQVVEATGFDLDVGEVGTTVVPTAEQLRILREQIDPQATIRFDFEDAQERREHVRSILEHEWQRALALAAESATVEQGEQLLLAEPAVAGERGDVR